MNTKVAKFLEWAYAALKIHLNLSCRDPDLERAHEQETHVHSTMPSVRSSMLRLTQTVLKNILPLNPARAPEQTCCRSCSSAHAGRTMADSTGKLSRNTLAADHPRHTRKIAAPQPWPIVPMSTVRAIAMHNL